MSDYTCHYRNGNVPVDADDVASREVTVTLDPEDGISILRALREACCPEALRTAALAIVNR